MSTAALTAASAPHAAAETFVAAINGGELEAAAGGQLGRLGGLQARNDRPGTA